MRVIFTSWKALSFDVLCDVFHHIFAVQRLPIRAVRRLAVDHQRAKLASVEVRQPPHPILGLREPGTCLV
jgi:hypothetical protein